VAKTLDPRREAQAEEVGERRQAEAPQRNREHESHQHEADGIAERIGRASCEPLVVDRARGAEARLGAEPRGKDRERREAQAEAPSGDEVVGLGTDAPADDAPIATCAAM